MYKIEFNDEITIEAILSSFNILNEAEIASYIDINGVIIYGDDVNLEEKVKQEYIKYKEGLSRIKSNDSENNDLKKQDNENNSDNNDLKKQDNDLRLREIFASRNDLYLLSQDLTFLFEIGVVLQYIKEEYKEDMLNYYISVYANSSKNKQGIELCKDLDYVSNLLLIIEDDSTLIQKYFKIQQIMNRVFDNEDEKFKLELAIKRIEEYAIHGVKIRELLFLDILNDKLSQKNNELNKILKRTLF